MQAQAPGNSLVPSDLLKLLAYILAVLLGGALLSPLLVSGGQWLLNSTTDEGWLVSEIRKADFARYFSRSMQLCAVLGLWPLIRWTRMDRSLFPSWTPARIGFRHYALGFALAAGLLLLLGAVFVQAGVYKIRPQPAWTAWTTPLSAALGAGILEELFFRGALLGLLLRTQSPLSAVVSSSLLFSWVHFLRPPESWHLPLDQVDWASGFQALGAIFGTFGDTDFLLAEFATLFAVGAVVAAARLKTGQLWASMGLHGGWVFGLKYFSAITYGAKTLRAGDHLPWIGLNLKIGLAPLLVIALTGWIALRLLPPANTQTSSTLD